jgi:hypothetical protein
VDSVGRPDAPRCVSAARRALRADRSSRDATSRRGATRTAVSRRAHGRTAARAHASTRGTSGPRRGVDCRRRSHASLRGVLAEVQQETGERVPHLAWCPEHAVVVAIRQHLPATREHAVHGPRDPRADRLHPAPQRPARRRVVARPNGDAAEARARAAWNRARRLDSSDDLVLVSTLSCERSELDRSAERDARSRRPPDATSSLRAHAKTTP